MPEYTGITNNINSAPDRYNIRVTGIRIMCNVEIDKIGKWT